VPLASEATPDDLIARAADRNPFASRKLISHSPPTVPVPVVADQTLHVLGTVVDSLGASFALCQLGAAPPVVLHVGQRLGDYELRRVDKASAVFLTPEGGRVERRVPRGEL
jgi:hypothetical protein